METFSTLYKKSSQGKIEIWNISVKETEENFGEIITRYGEMGGKLQVTSDVVKKGKNIGRANETTALQQAQSEAKSKYEKKLKDGYIADLEKAKAGIVDSIIQGGLKPMLAHIFLDHAHKMPYPCYGQPKLDGTRMIAIKRGDDVSLWTRTQKRITSLPHIEKAIREQVKIENAKIDGEAYNHDYSKSFEKIISSVRKEDTSEEALKIQFHIYDLAENDQTFEERHATILQDIEESEHIKIVETTYITSRDIADKTMQEYLQKEYEGLMLRNPDSLYENKRSYGLLKYKEFESSEFVIVGATEGRGKLQGKLGAFWCTTTEYDPKRIYSPSDEDVFEATPACTEEQKEEYWENFKSYKGQHLEVKYQNLTAYGIPRFPVGMRIRYPDRGL
jgi:DNA ligase 1